MNLRGFLMAIYAFFSLIIVIISMYFFRKKIHKIRKFWASTMISLVGVKLEEVGTLDCDADILILNHNSMFDITILEYLHSKDIAWVAHEKLSKIPIFGWIFKFPKLILINPDKKSSLKTLLKRAKEESKNKRPIGIFPEGTRGENDDIISFQKGTKVIAERLNLKVQAIVLIDTRKRLDTKTFISTPGNVKVIYLDTVEASYKNWFEEIEEQVNLTYKQNI